MARGYELWLRESAHTFLQTLEPADSNRLLSFFDSLMAHPFQSGDYLEYDGPRECEVSLVGEFAVTWWLDFPVGEIKVVSIDYAD